MSKQERLAAAGFKARSDDNPRNPIQEAVDKTWGRAELERRVNERKERIFGDAVKGYNNQRAEKATHKASLAQLRWAATADESDLEDAVENGVAFLHYH